jgi:hypothetical protein
MDAAVTDPTSPMIGYTGKSIEERASVIEGTIANQDRIFDMLHEGQQNLRSYTAGLRAEMRDDRDNRFGEVDTRIDAMDVRLNTKIDSNLKWILGVQIAMWVTIIDTVPL